MVWIKFIVCVVVIFISGRKIARYGDIIAEKTGLGGVWIGLVLIAMLTSLPEFFNGVSAVTLVDAPGLTIGNLLGANMFNLFNLTIISIGDLLYTKGPILAAVSENPPGYRFYRDAHDSRVHYRAGSPSSAVFPFQLVEYNPDVAVPDGSLLQLSTGLTPGTDRLIRSNVCH